MSSGGTLLVSKGFSTEVQKATVNRTNKARDALEANGIRQCLMEPKEVIKTATIKALLKNFHSGDLFSKCATINEETEADAELEGLFVEDTTPGGTKSSLEKKPSKKTQAKRKRKSPTEEVDNAAKQFSKQIDSKINGKPANHAPPKKKKKQKKKVQEEPKDEEEEEEGARQPPRLLMNFAQAILDGDVKAEDPCNMEIEEGDTVHELMQRNSDQFATAWMLCQYAEMHMEGYLEKQNKRFISEHF